MHWQHQALQRQGQANARGDFLQQAALWVPLAVYNGCLTKSIAKQNKQNKMKTNAAVYLNFTTSDQHEWPI